MKPINKRPSYYRSSIKDEIRNVLAEHCPKHANVLTLAGPYAKDAKILIERCGARVSSIEHALPRFKAQCHLTKYQRDFHKYYGEAVDILPWLAKHAEPFDVVFLDFCGPYTLTNERTIELVLKGLLAPGGLLAITFLKGHDGDRILKETRLCSEWLERGPMEYRDDRLNKIGSALGHLARDAQTNLQRVHTQEYRNSDDATEMMFFLYRQIKNEKKEKGAV